MVSRQFVEVSEVPPISLVIADQKLFESKNRMGVPFWLRDGNHADCEFDFADLVLRPLLKQQSRRRSLTTPDGFALSPIRAVFLDSIVRVSNGQ
jgi:hypothetical protein